MYDYAQFFTKFFLLTMTINTAYQGKQDNQRLGVTATRVNSNNGKEGSLQLNLVTVYSRLLGGLHHDCILPLFNDGTYKYISISDTSQDLPPLGQPFYLI